MYELIGCPHCHRHARATEAACPFCGAALEGAVPGEVHGVSRRELTRGAIVLGAAALLGACGSSAEEDRTQETTGGDTNTGGDTTTGGEVVVDDEPHDDVIDDEWMDERRRRRPPCDPDDMACMTMPYGAPALPESIV